MDILHWFNAEGGERFTKGAYFLGKIVYGKGWEELLTLLDWHQRHTKDKQTSHPALDAYGTGEAFEMVTSTSTAVHGHIDTVATLANCVKPSLSSGRSPEDPKP